MSGSKTSTEADAGRCAVHRGWHDGARVDEIRTTDTKLVRYHEDGLLLPVMVCLPYLTQLKIDFLRRRRGAGPAGAVPPTVPHSTAHDGPSGRGVSQPAALWPWPAPASRARGAEEPINAAYV